MLYWNKDTIGCVLNNEISKISKTNITWAIIYLAFWGIAVISAFGLYNFTRGFTICWRITALPGIPSESCSSQHIDPLGTPVFVDEEVAVTGDVLAESLLVS